MCDMRCKGLAIRFGFNHFNVSRWCLASHIVHLVLSNCHVNRVLYLHFKCYVSSFHSAFGQRHESRRKLSTLHQAEINTGSFMEKNSFSICFLKNIRGKEEENVLDSSLMSFKCIDQRKNDQSITQVFVHNKLLTPNNQGCETKCCFVITLHFLSLIHISEPTRPY